MEHFNAFWKRRGLLWELVKRGIKLRYRKSYLGIIWSLLEPLLSTIVLTIVFGTLLGRGGRDFPLYVLCGRLLYSFFASSTKSAARSIRANSSMIKKVYVPKYLYPLSSILFNYIITGISLLVLIPLCIYCRQYPTFHMLYSFLPFAVLFILTYGCGMILATITVFFRDMEYLWSVFTTLLMYMSAVFYSIETYSPFVQNLFLLNPVYLFIRYFRKIVIEATIPTIWFHLLMLADVLIVVLLGCLMYKKNNTKFLYYV